jgi:hypothetical protein
LACASGGRVADSHPNGHVTARNSADIVRRRSTKAAYLTAQCEKIVPRFGPQPATPSQYYLDIKEALRTLRSPGVTPDVLKELTQKRYGEDPRTDYKGTLLFSEWEFRAEPVPTVDMLVNLPDYEAYCKIIRANNVRHFVTLPAPPPKAHVRTAILERSRRRWEARQTAAADTNRERGRGDSSDDPTDTLG